MKTEKLMLINEILVIQMNHWVLYPVALTVGILLSGFTIGGMQAGILWGICGLMTLLFLAFRERVERLWLFLFLNLAAVLLFFVLPVHTLAERILCAACGIVYFIDSMTKRFRSEGSSYAQPVIPVVTIAVSAGGILVQHYMVQYYQVQRSWDIYYVLSLVGVLSLSLITSYIRHYLRFLVVNESSTDCLPAKDIFRSGMGLVSIYTVIGAVILLLGTSFGWLGVIWNGMKYVIIAVLRFLISILPSEVPPEEFLYQETPSEAQSGEIVLPEPSAPFLLWQILEVIVIIAFYCGVIFVIIRELIKLVKYIRKRFAEGLGHRSQPEAEGEEIDVREKCNLTHSANREGQKRSLFGFLTPAQRVRRLYKKKILSSAFELTGGGEDRGGRLALLTARECGEKLELPEMTELYEQVRYSDGDVTQETLRRMKEVCKG